MKLKNEWAHFDQSQGWRAQTADLYDLIFDGQGYEREGRKTARGYPANEAAIFKDGLVVAPLLLLLQAIAAPVLSVLLLYSLTAFYEVKFDEGFTVLSVM